MPDRKRINLYFTDEEDEELYARITAIATKEKRSISQTAKFLIIEALATKESDRTQPPPPTPDNGEASQTEPPKQGQRQMSKRGKGKES